MKIGENFTVAFPARNAFYQGLCRDFYDEFADFRNIYEAASSFLDEDLYEISFVNPELKPELHTVCLITYCYGLYQLLIQSMRKPLAAIGFSQGEFTAVSAAGSVAFPGILKLVYELEMLLLTDREIREGSMARVMELDREMLKKCCQQVDPAGEYLVLAITYSNDQNVVSGRNDKVKELAKLAREEGARWVIPLNGGGAFHSPLCRQIMITAEGIFNKYEFQDPEYPVFSCIDGQEARDGKTIKSKISKQIALPILWDTLIKNQKKFGGQSLIELGPGCTISGNTRIIDDTIKCWWINDLNDFQNIIQKNGWYC